MKTTTSFIASGDAFMTRHLPEGGYDGLDGLRELISRHDFRFNNLEFTAHDYEGTPSAFSGGTWAMSPSSILDDLKSFGFNIYNTANNHSLDYSQDGLLATIRHLRERGMLFAGIGENAAFAASTVYLECDGARIAMISVSATFHDSDAAGAQGSVVRGRPGVNSLRHSTVYHVETEYFEMLKEIAEATGMNNAIDHAVKKGWRQLPTEDIAYLNAMCFKKDTVNRTETAPDRRDTERTLSGIKNAKRQADYVVISFHSHDFAGPENTEPAEYIKTFVHACIDAGADAVIGHGPHLLQGIELYKGKPIFYSMGNFIFQTDTVECQPREAFEHEEVEDDTAIGEYMDKRSRNDTVGFPPDPEIWRSVLASFTFDSGELKEILLYPVTLHREMPRSRRGLPTLSRDEAVLEHLAQLSIPFGTEISVGSGVGKVII